MVSDIISLMYLVEFYKEKKNEVSIRQMISLETLANYLKVVWFTFLIYP